MVHDLLIDHLLETGAWEPFIEGRWRVSPERSEEGQILVLPDNASSLVWYEGEWSVLGPVTTAFLYCIERGEEISGVRFKPGWLSLLLGEDACALVDMDIFLDAVDTTQLAEWERRVAKAHEEGTSKLLDALIKSHASSVSELASEVGYGARNLRRKLHDLFGYTGSTWLRIQRFRELVRQIAETESFAELSLEVGYADQAHMSRECRRLTHLTPSQMLTWISESSMA